MSVKSRDILKYAFSNGSIPTQDDFSNFIDSFVHKKEDGLFSDDHGLRIVPTGNSQKLISFFNNLNVDSPLWSFEKNDRGKNAYDINIANIKSESVLYLSLDGNVGIGNKYPKEKIEVNGNVTYRGRRGTYKCGTIPGDGKWHVIVPSLNKCNAFEIIAKINKPGKGMHAIMYAIALSAFNGKRSDIVKHHAYYGSYREKIKLRWRGSDFNYNLEMKTFSDYGGSHNIEYYVTNLWWDSSDTNINETN